MRREGSPWQGIGAVVLKELADNLSSARMRVLEWLIVLTAFAALYGAIGQLRDTTAEDPFLLLRLFTVSRSPLPSFVAILGFLSPLMAIGLGFDTINGEYNRRTLSRILAQPIYRDALLAGKFLAGLATLAISLTCMWLLVLGLALLFLGVPPGGEEIARSLVFLVVAVIYGGVWLALAMLLSVIFRSPATAALVALGIWLLLTLIWPMLSPAIASVIAPPDPRYALLGLQTPETLEVQQILGRLSPNNLFGEAMLAVLSPTTRALGAVFIDQLRGALLGAPLPFGQSLLLAWPQIVGLLAATILLFVGAYVVFQRQEVRA
jgi:ABC-2 type transport system permease protein